MKGSFYFGKAVALMTAVSVLQVLGVAGAGAWLFVKGMTAADPDVLVLAVLLAISACAMLTFISLRRSMNLIAERLRQAETSIQALENLNNTLRAQRHDFMNHLQVVYSLMDLKSFDEAEQYIEKVYGDIQKVSNVMRTSLPAVNAILQAKQRMCETRGIAVSFDIRSSLSELPVAEWEFCRVLGNIIDNSINALSDTGGKPDKHLEVALYEDLRGYGFRVSNNGPAIPPGLWDSIFEAGFTTRSSGQGMGLSICRSIVDEAGGSLKVLSDDSETVFEGWLPRKAGHVLEQVNGAG